MSAAAPAAYKTLGRLADLRRLARREAHDLLDLPSARWTHAVNRAWMEEGVRRQQPFLLISRGDFRGTVLEWELRWLRSVGYRSDGEWWRPR